MNFFLLYTFGCVLVLSTWASSGKLREGMQLKTHIRREILNRQTDEEPNLEGVADQLALLTLEDNLRATNLDNFLTDDGPFTIFGPTDEAFLQMAGFNVNTLVVDGIMKYHVVFGNFKTDNLTNEQLLDTVLEGKQIRINKYTVNEEPVITAQCAPLDLAESDVEASNGVIHVVNDVLVSPIGTIREIEKTIDNLSTLDSAIEGAKLENALAGEGPFTLFAPTDEAFNKLPWAFLNSVLADPSLLMRVLLYHVVPGTYCSVGLTNATIAAMSGDDLTISVFPDDILVDEAKSDRCGCECYKWCRALD